MHRYVLALHAIAATALLSPKRRRRAPTKDDGWRELSPPTPLAPRTDYDWTSGTPTDAACWPSVSVVTITRDRADFLAEALVSMARQDYPSERVEIIVADDGAGEPVDNVRYLAHAARQRLGAKRNACLARATGELVATWDDDDYFAPNRLRAQAAALMRGGDLCFLGADAAYRFDVSDGEFRENRGGSFVQPCTMMFRRQLWGPKTRYDDGADLGEDLAFLDALLESGAAVTTADVPFVRVRHARNVAQDAAGDGDEGVVAARAAAEACGLPARTVDFLAGLSAT
jgi:hypothetical protein